MYPVLGCIAKSEFDYFLHKKPTGSSASTLCARPTMCVQKHQILGVWMHHQLIARGFAYQGVDWEMCYFLAVLLRHCLKLHFDLLWEETTDSLIPACLSLVVIDFLQKSQF